MGIRWSEQAGSKIAARGITETQVVEAIHDEQALWFERDWASISGEGIRIIGEAASRNTILVVIVTRDGDDLIVWNSWVANSSHEKRYRRET